MGQNKIQSGLPIIVFVIYRLIILAMRIMTFHPLEKESIDDSKCDPSLQILYNVFYESLNPNNLTYGLFFTKLTVFASVIFLILKYSSTHFFSAYIYHTWYFLFFMYIANAVCYSLIRQVSSGFCYTMNNDFFDYGSMIFVAIFAIKASFDVFAKLETDWNKNITFPVGWLVLLTTGIYYMYVLLVTVIYELEAQIYKLLYDQNSDGKGIFQQFITYMMILNEPKNILDMMVHFFLTPMNIAGVITIFVIVIYLIMKEERKNNGEKNELEKENDSIKSKARLERIHSIIYGCVMILFFTLTLIMFFISGDVLDSKYVVFRMSSIVLILLCILLSYYRTKKIKDDKADD